MLARRGFLTAATAFLLAPVKALLGDTLNRAAIPKLGAVTVQEEKIIREFYEQGFNGRRADVIEKYLPRDKAQKCQQVMAVCMVFVAIIEIVVLRRVDDVIEVSWTPAASIRVSTKASSRLAAR